MRELEGYNNFKLYTVTLLKSPDEKIIKMESYGEITYVDSKDFISREKRYRRLELYLAQMESRDQGSQATFRISKESLSTETDNFMQLFLPRQERNGGVYTVDLNEGELYMRDSEDNQFVVSKDGDISSKLSVSFNLENRVAKWDREPVFDGEAYIDPKNMDLVTPNVWYAPQLFMFTTEGQIFAFYDEDMLLEYFEDKTLQNGQIIRSRDNVTQSDGYTVLSEIVEDRTQEKPSVLPNMFKHIPVTKLTKETPEKKKFVIRKFRKFEPVQESDIEEIDLTTWKVQDWEKTKRANEEKNVVHGRSKEETQTELALQQRMLVLGLEMKNIISYGESNKDEITNESNVVFMPL
jgi:hypothetical protein